MQLLPLVVVCIINVMVSSEDTADTSSLKLVTPFVLWILTIITRESAARPSSRDTHKVTDKRKKNRETLHQKEFIAVTSHVTQSRSFALHPVDKGT